MAIKIYKKNTAGRRNMSVVKSSMLSGGKPEKSLLMKKHRKVGRSAGKISVRHKGAGNKKRLRKIDFLQDKLNVWGRVATIEKDPFRSAFIALINYEDGEKRYILACEGMKVGQKIISQEKAPIKKGNRSLLKNIPVGTVVFNLELFPGKGGQTVRSAGSGALVTAVEGKNAQVKMPSGEVRKVLWGNLASLGQVSNPDHNLVNIGKAGRVRLMGVRPTVRGTAMNPVDHSYGGGEGKQPRGTKRPKTIWGKVTGGHRTRNKKKRSSKLIISRRGKKK